MPSVVVLQLFTLELIADDGPEGGLKYNQQPDVYLDACLEAYDTALTSTGAVEKVDHQVVRATPPLQNHNPRRLGPSC